MFYLTFSTFSPHYDFQGDFPPTTSDISSKSRIPCKNAQQETFFMNSEHKFSVFDNFRPGHKELTQKDKW